MKGEIRPLPGFAYFAPNSVDEAVSLLKKHQEGARLLAGGTDLLLDMKQRIVWPAAMLDLNRIPNFSTIEMRGDDLHIGAMTRLNNIRDSATVKERAPLLSEAIGRLAASPIRNRATIGGNLCNASPAADTAPPLLVLDASLRLRGPDGERIVKISEFFVGPGQTVRKADEVLTEVVIPCETGRSAFAKLGRRKSFTLSIVSVAGFGVIKDGKFTDVRVALGAVAPTPIRSRMIEDALRGLAADEEHIARAVKRVKQEVSPISDVRASAEYRREMAGVLTKRVLQRIAMGAEKCS
jgi:carbon-monoxide dehydrogenase medium subunit